MQFHLLFLAILTWSYGHDCTTVVPLSGREVGEIGTREVLSPRRRLNFFYNPRYSTRDLWRAIQDKDFDLFSEILNCNCVNLEERDGAGETALIIALRLPNSEMAEALIEAGADVKARGAEGIAPLHLSCFHQLRNVSRLLLESGADVNQQTDSLERPMTYAQSKNSVPLLKMLINRGAEINFQDSEGETPLHEAAAYGSDKNADFLIKRGANLTVLEQGGRTPGQFICACKDVVDSTLQVPCFPNTCSDDNIDVLESIFRRAERRLMRGIVQRDNQFKTYNFWIDVANGTLEDVQKSLNAEDIELRAVTQTKTEFWIPGQTALHIAVVRRNVEIIEALLDAEADPNVGNTDSQTPLHLAVDGNDMIIAVLLLSYDADVDERNREGETPLHIASRFGFVRMSEVLVRTNATLEIRNHRGDTAAELVCSCILEDTCPLGFCENAEDVNALLDVLKDERDERRRQQLTTLYFRSDATEEEATVDRLPDEDDGAGSLGTFIGVLFVCAFVFFVVYGGCIVRIRRRNEREQLAQALHQPGPSA